ncbi:MAG: hypothetical protein AB1714_18555 [Acidobacteriota bacterium]
MYVLAGYKTLNCGRRATGTKKKVFLTMVTSFGVTDNAYAKELVATSLTLDALF